MSNNIDIPDRIDFQTAAGSVQLTKRDLAIASKTGDPILGYHTIQNALEESDGHLVFHMRRFSCLPKPVPIAKKSEFTLIENQLHKPTHVAITCLQTSMMNDEEKLKWSGTLKEFSSEAQSVIENKSSRVFILHPGDRLDWKARKELAWSELAHDFKPVRPDLTVFGQVKSGHVANLEFCHTDAIREGYSADQIDYRLLFGWDAGEDAKLQFKVKLALFDKQTGMPLLRETSSPREPGMGPDEYRDLYHLIRHQRVLEPVTIGDFELLLDEKQPSDLLSHMYGIDGRRGIMNPKNPKLPDGLVDFSTGDTVNSGFGNVDKINLLLWQMNEIVKRGI